MAFKSENHKDSGILSSARSTSLNQIEISIADYSRFCSFLEKHSGILLGENKQYLVKNRLRTIFEEANGKSLGQLIDCFERGELSQLRARVIDLMTTNETLWFRDSHPFEILKEVILPEYAIKQTRPLRIWSAASSTGQEAYSISITVTEYLKRNPGSFPHQIEVVATDISQTAIKQAKEGRYDNYEIIRGLNTQFQQQYFVQDGDKRRIVDAIKQRVRFQPLNLLQSYSLLGQFDVIFCRNVLIYFSNKVKSDILSRMARSLKPGGYLFLGGSEPIANYSDDYEMIRCKQGVVYRLKAKTNLI